MLKVVNKFNYCVITLMLHYCFAMLHISAEQKSDLHFSRVLRPSRGLHYITSSDTNITQIHKSLFSWCCSFIWNIKVLNGIFICFLNVRDGHLFLLNQPISLSHTHTVTLSFSHFNKISKAKRKRKHYNSVLIYNHSLAKVKVQVGRLWGGVGVLCSHFEKPQASC